jgi:glycosyltransferase involved in cell wall biosynthesis
MMKPSLLHIGLCVGSASMPKYFDIQTIYTELYLDSTLIERLAGITEAPDYVFLQIQGDKYDGQRSTLDLIEPLKRLKDMGSYIINWNGDMRNETPLWMYIFFPEAVSITCFSNQRDVDFFKAKGLNTDFMQIGIDEAIFKPTGDNYNNHPEIVFQGNRFDHFPLSSFRNELVAILKNKYGSRFKAFGNGYEGNTNGNQYEEAKVYRSAKIAINCSHYNSDRYTSDRIFRILGSGCFCLSHNYDGIEKDFENNNHLVTFNDANDLIQKIDYWLEEDKRKEIAESGQKHCFENFTYTNMVNHILKLKQ